MNSNLRFRWLPLWIVITLWLIAPRQKTVDETQRNLYLVLLDDIYSTLIAECIDPRTFQPRNWLVGQIYFAISAWIFEQKAALLQMDRLGVLLTGWLKE